MSPGISFPQENEAPFRAAKTLTSRASIHLCFVVCVRPVNRLTPNDPYRGRTAPLTSKVAFYIFIQQI